jgi:uncharacterized protein
MLMNHAAIAPARFSAVLEAAEAAAAPSRQPSRSTRPWRSIPSSARRARISPPPPPAGAGRRGARDPERRADYAAAIPEAGSAPRPTSPRPSRPEPSPLKPPTREPCAPRHAAGDGPAPCALPTVADLAAEATGTDWPALIDKCIGLWAAGHFDRGQALWSPAPGSRGLHRLAVLGAHDLTPEIAGSRASAPMSPARPTPPSARSCPPPTPSASPRAAAPTAFHRLAIEPWRLGAACALAAVAGRTARAAPTAR